MFTKNESNQKHLMQIAIIYRFIALLICTIVFIYFAQSRTLLSQLLVIIGMFLSCLIATFLYLKVAHLPAQIVLTIVMEIAANGVFIAISGGFSSPYLWYSISCLTMLMVMAGNKTVIPAAVTWFFCAAVLGSIWHLTGISPTQAIINIAIGFLVVASGFYILLEYAKQLTNSRQELALVIENLEIEKARSEQALKSMLELYETVNLLNISDAGLILDELNKMICKSLNIHQSLLLSLNHLKEVSHCNSHGLSLDDQALIVEAITKLDLAGAENYAGQTININGTSYTLNLISYAANNFGIMVFPKTFELPQPIQPNFPNQAQFYLKLLGIILNKIEFQAVAEQFIIAEEQNRIANGIHDTVIQKLFAVSCNIHLLSQRIGQYSGAETITNLNLIKKSVDSTMKELREAIYNLYWDDSQALFSNKLSEYINEISGLNNSLINLHIDADCNLMSGSQKTTVYRVVCEAVNNAIRHGNATIIDARIATAPSNIAITIQDNGNGFNPATQPKGSHGLRNMYKIVGLLKGQLDINSQIGQGTVIKVLIPKNKGG